VTTDPGNSNLYYWIEWGDGSHEEWFGPCASGAIVTISHAWSDKGNYSITAKAKNTLGIESGWSEPFVITIIAPKLEIGLVKGGLFKIKTVIKNTGAIDIMHVQWNITLTGGAFIGQKTSGTVLNIPPGAERTVTSDLILGLGKTMITVTASHPYSSAIKSQNATILLFFIKM
ncbi:MAG: Zn-dependent exopeptidase M28, partial [Thermoplasmata archaeon]|nr:Zn-dependent exopeptidase M28 [Thermoplasmata archaeon]